MKPSVQMPFEDWLPDSPDYWSANAQTAQNCLPTLASPNYESINGITLSSVGQPNSGPYQANAASFLYNAGTPSLSPYMLIGSNLAGIASNKTGTISLWHRIDGSTGGEQTIFEIGAGTTPDFRVSYNASGHSLNYRITGFNSSATKILDISTSANYSPGTTWYNVLASWNLATAATNLFINNVSDKNVTTATNDTINYADGAAFALIAISRAINNQMFGSLSEVWFNNSFIDFTSAPNRALFIAGGFPVNLGSSGQTPTGSSPLLYLKSSASQFNVNSGTGGNFTLTNGPLTNATSSPSNATTTSQFLGAISTVDSTDVPHTYAGTSTQLAEITSTSANNLSKSGGYTANSIWKFTQFTGLSAGNIVVATDYNDPIQSMVVGGGAFADLSASAPKASAIATVNQFLMLGDTSGGTYNGATQAAIPNRVWWSGIGNPISWPDPATTAATAVQSNFKDLPPNLGRIQDIKGRYEYGIVFQENGITRFQYQGGDVPFYITTYELKRGLYCRNGAIQIGNLIYFPASSGFYVTDAASVEPIGHNMVDQTWLADLNTTYLDHVRVSEIPDKKVILWSYPSIAMTLQGGFPVCDKVIAYNYEDKRWAMGMVGQSIDLIFQAKSLAYTMEQLDTVNTNLDLITPSLDDPFWNGGNPVVGVFGIQLVTGSTYASFFGAMTGTPLTATLDTKISNLNQGGLAFVTEYIPVVLGGTPTITGQIGTQAKLKDAITWSSAASPETRTGKISCRSNARYHTVRLNISGGFSNALGVEPEWKPAGYS